MRHSIYVETPFGDFQYVETDFFKGSSCEQCAFRAYGHCNDIDCAQFDSLRHHFHLVHRYEVAYEK